MIQGEEVLHLVLLGDMMKLKQEKVWLNLCYFCIVLLDFFEEQAPMLKTILNLIYLLVS